MPLFERKGRRLELNGNGAELLSSLRDAMRLLDDGLGRLEDTRHRGPIRIAAPSAFASVLLVPILNELSAAYPSVVPALGSTSAERANAALLDGTLDLVLLDDPVPHPHVRLERLVGVEYAVYGSSTHPLASKRRVRADELARHPFVAPPPGGDDHFPKEWSRRVAAHVSQLRLGMEICARSDLLAVLPRPIADRYPGPGALERLAISLPGDAALYLLRRPPLGPQPVLDTIVDALRRVIETWREPGRT
jgi:DNA-binding transcriptional LysR family regulator